MENTLANSRYTAEEKAAVFELFGEADSAGIGEQLLLPRTQEAQAKRVPADKLLEALSLEIERLDLARTILLEIEDGGGVPVLTDDAGWLRTANLIAWGMEKEELIALVIPCGDDIETYLESSYLYVSLVTWGLPQDAAGPLITAVQQSALHPDDYMGIQEIFLQSRRLKIQPEEMSSRITREIPDVSTIRQLRRKVLK